MQYFPRWNMEPLNRTIKCSPEDGLRRLTVKEHHGGRTTKRVSDDPVEFELTVTHQTSEYWRSGRGYSDRLEVTLSQQGQTVMNFDLAAATRE